MTGQTTIFAHLEELILSGVFQEGTKLPPERRLAEDFGVSRPVIREVVRSLAARNLVQVIPGRGSYVRRARSIDAAQPLDMLFRRHQATARDLVEARKMIECEAAFLAALRAEPADLQAMRIALDQFDQATDLVLKVICDITFHSSVARASHNPVIETMFGSITSLTVELMLRSLGDPDVSRVGLPYHRKAFEAIRDHKPDQAHAAMAEHLAVAESLYGEDLDRSLDSLARRELLRLLGPGVTLEELLTSLTAGVTMRPIGGDGAKVV